MDSTLFAPGEVITASKDFIIGHGVHTEEGKAVSSVLGKAELVDRLLTVVPVKSRYRGEVGDVVVGRVVEIFQKQWRIDVGSRVHAALLLSAVNLPGGVLRRKDETDELNMRAFLQEGDLISAEVQKIHNDGSLALHSRNLQYGRLENGFLIKVSASLIKRSKKHFHTFPCGVKCVLGMNGWIWLEGDEGASETKEQKEKSIEEYKGTTILPEQASAVAAASSAYSFPVISPSTRENLARMRNVISAMYLVFHPIYPDAMQSVYDISLTIFESPSALLIEENARHLMDLYIQLEEEKEKEKEKEMKRKLELQQQQP
ncbi:putative exosome complex exonuclease RRP4 [Monocercomonoides exilis]|uniref:putative exosome complex exonuclease RRP4 n=1 Tax=Monocercomonoides exilis TaxID=2049356 RepID=UPI00355A46BB|nr:putative exosome complex exonuclease RRP4 [Monocercomonoides exilis]|eukprot:MONOS_7169.1-p1 / transcript=MONOS_7169.1 / gene=MONOS_7169 / organism=Monocercomonoides_exilis_PA203 / gene_product=exosome complex exonuclease RRP4 / transcript_product=exosome complex exonuclease RRP4 / location=Mono_scaffold00239:24070-25571(+) / protein_length=315 / sequence_SO=supercontig / SO=protein_coding / is_pseudo=false